MPFFLKCNKYIKKRERERDIGFTEKEKNKDANEK